MPGLCVPFADFGADAVVDAVGDDRPAVIDAGADDVDLVASLRTVLMRPEFAGLRMQCRALHVAVAEGELFRFPAGLADEGVVGGDAPVVVQADYRAGMIVRPLSALHLAAVSQGDVKVAGAVEDKS
jgi:hypothetical protein